MSLPVKNVDVFCSVQRALLSKVTPNLRAVYIFINKKNSYNLIFYYNEILSEHEEELVSLADTEFISDFPSPDYQTSIAIQIISYPNQIPKHGFCLYQRYEVT